MANYTILLIDYEPRSIERFRQPLTDAGYRVEIATDGLTGIDAFHRLNPDMVLVEAMIPKKHGFEVCQELKRSPHGRRTPVLITTGVYKGRKYRTQALHIYGCDEYIEKPIAPEQLLAVVGKFFTSKAPTSSGLAGETPTRSMSDASPVSPASGAKESPARPPHGKTPVPRAVVGDLTEDEIMARLDAILPGAEATVAPETLPAAAAVVPAASIAAAEAEPGPSIEPDLAEDLSGEDPFAQMQAELNAELGSLSTALALEPAPILDAAPDPIPSDQLLSPSVLEALPSPDPLPLPAEQRSVPVHLEDVPGQVVSFDAKRSRKAKKHGKKTPDRPLMTAPRPAAEIPAPRVQERPRPSSSIKLPSGSLVESDLDAGRAKRGVSAWVWAVLILVVAAAMYFVFFRGELNPTITTSARPVPPPAPVEQAEIPSPPASEPEARPTDEDANLVLNAVEAPPPARRPVPEPAQKAASQPAKPAPPPSPKAPTSTSPAPAASISAWPIERPAPASAPVPTAPAGAEDAASGVETIAEAGAEPEAAPQLAPGTLVDDPDTLPVTLARKLPTYSLRARELKLSGTVVMNVLVNERGTVDEVVLVSGINGADLNESTLKAARAWTYRPATKGGVPVKYWKREQVVFKR
ncbi:MAG TPA: TonB family protein [Candidatus Polarisedimenticolaceae bacterium]|nr:TonB family protein [Candidatus Polarisedimenticolaceae bacterium]